MRIDESKLTPEQRKEYLDILDQFATPFQMSQDQKKKSIINEKLRDLQTQHETGSYRFDDSETSGINSLLESGKIDGKTAVKMRQLLHESQEENLGYLFITFSHADEARIYLMENQVAYYDNIPLEISLKSVLDHSDCDQTYFLTKAHNNAKTVEEISKVR